MSTNDGGPAYPVKWIDWHDQGVACLTIRDHFAGLAMAAMLGPNHPYGGRPEEFIPAGAYRMADAMLRAREAGQ